MSDSASRVHKLAVPRFVTMVASERPNAFGDETHYVVDGYYQSGEAAFEDEYVHEATDAEGAVRIVLGRLRERGW